MGVIQNKIKEMQSYEEKTKNFLTTSGTIIAYDKVSNTADIEYDNPAGVGILSKNNVPVSHGELFAMGNQRGVKCSIAFQGGNIYSPIIIGICDTEYSINSFSEKNDLNSGGFLIDDKLESVPIDTDISPMYKDWINEDGSFFSQEQSGVADIDKEVQKTMFFIDKYSDQENGIINQETKALIKTCKNGDIKIFVGNDIGICINKKTGSIEMYGDVKIKGRLIQGGDTDG